ncbi:dnaJ homolog subfamily C member 17-like isoform X2 [Momordica charantia]|uniref:DnaJ homolog subfamily C member 17-like isoform X2 n=1 Tax=Momordica charantia TaxID=3673 RepID=A0A6J1C7C7_MOMCH|nr:dnaJ homolog subfamily C member 17-like isoform X2 [Momordica charantia]
MDLDHYAVLGLPSGEEDAKLTEKEISKAYRAKALELHPDKRPDDPNAHENFQALKSSYEILKDEKARRLFDDLLRVKRKQHRRQSECDSKRQRTMTDLEARERAAFDPDPATKDQEEEEKISRKLKEEIARIRAMHERKAAPIPSAMKQGDEELESRKFGSAGLALGKERMLKVSWDKTGEDYTAENLRELFSKFGEVEDVVIKHNKKKGSALVVMSTKDAVIASTRSEFGDLSNPLLVLPLQPLFETKMPDAERPPDLGQKNNLVGAGYQAFEDSILKKLQKAAEKQKS